MKKDPPKDAENGRMLKTNLKNILVKNQDVK